MEVPPRNHQVHRQTHKSTRDGGLIEAGFAAFKCAMETAPDQDRQGRRLVTGVNWSPGIVNPFRELGKVGESMDSLLADQEAGAAEPIALVVHLASPGAEYLDRGKSAVVIGRSE
jgi:hypothetical protein